MSDIVATLRRLGVTGRRSRSLMTRGTQSVTALVTIGFVGRFLTPEGQGYDYTILSFVAFVLLGEFGLSYAVMQSASHETAGVMTASRLRALLSGATRFNAWTTTAAVLAVIAIGTTMLGRTHTVGDASRICDVGRAVGAYHHCGRGRPTACPTRRTPRRRGASDRGVAISPEARAPHRVRPLDFTGARARPLGDRLAYAARLGYLTSGSARITRRSLVRDLAHVSAEGPRSTPLLADRGLAVPVAHWRQRPVRLPDLPALHADHVRAPRGAGGRSGWNDARHYQWIAGRDDGLAEQPGAALRPPDARGAYDELNREFGRAVR